MITDNDWLADEQTDDSVPSAHVTTSMAPHLDEEKESDPDLFERLDLACLLRADLGPVSFLQEEEERALTRTARQAWQHILHLLQTNAKLIASVVGKELPLAYLTTMREGDILTLLTNLRRAHETRQSSPLTARTNESLLSLLEEVHEDLMRFRHCRDELIRRHLPLVLRFAQQHAGRGVDYLDLVQEGVLGLMRAVEKFDPDKGVRFTTYAVWWIWQAMVAARDVQGKGVVQRPAYAEAQRRRLLYLSQRLASVLHRDPTPEELFHAGKDTLRPIAFTYTPLATTSLDVPVGEDEDMRVEELIPDSESISPEDCAIRDDIEDKLHRALQRLKPRDAEVLRLRFGLAHEETFTLQEIGARLGVTKERVRQIEAQALERLKVVCEDAGLDAAA